MYTVDDMGDNSVPQGVVDFMAAITNEIINPIMGIIFVLALVYFLWGLMNFIFNAGEEAKLVDGRKHMLWGLIGMTIMVSVFAIIQVGLNTFDVAGTDLPEDLPL